MYYRVHKDGKLKLKLKIEILTFLLNEFRKFYIHHENLETHLQASTLPKTIRIDNGDNDVGYLKVWMIIRYIAAYGPQRGYY